MKKESNQQSMEEVEHWEHTLPSPIKADRMEESRDAAGQDVRKRQHEDEHCGMASAMPLIVWTARPDGNVDYYNQRWFEYTGLTFEQTRGQGWLMVLHPDDRQMCLKHWREALRTGEPYEIEYRFRRADGAYRWHLGRALPLRDQQQHILSWSGTATDIDDQKCAEEQLSIRACQQAAVAEFGQHALKGMDLPDLFDKLLLKVSQTLNVVYVSLSELLDDGTLQVHSRNREGMTYLAVNEWQASQAAYTLSAKEPVIIVDDLRSERRFSVPPEVLDTFGLVGSVSVVIEGNPDPYAVLIVHTTQARVFTRDDINFLQAITNVLAAAIERKRTEAKLAHALKSLQAANEQLEHANKAQNDFVSIISHEFRSTLTGIQGFSELIRDEDFSSREIREYANDINTDARRLSRMINELLDLNRMKSGRMAFNSERVDLNEIITDVVERTRANTPVHQILLHLDASLPMCLGDRDKLTQVVTNLLNNAMKYSPGGGVIILSSELKDEQVHVWVQDSGVGIPASALEKIFEPYTRIASGATRFVEGSGIGLAIVRQIMQIHGGKVWAESTLGEGSTFHFTLPLGAPEKSSSPLSNLI